MTVYDRYQDPEWLLRNTFTDANGICRWLGNSQIPAPHILNRLGISGDALNRHLRARIDDLHTFSSAYSLHHSCVNPNYL